MGQYWSRYVCWIWFSKNNLRRIKKYWNGVSCRFDFIIQQQCNLKSWRKTNRNGSLVIVNDRYGVKINEVLAGNNAGISPSNATPQDQNSFDDEDEEEEDEENYSEEGNEEESEGEDNNEENDEDFDYSDFELEDENI